MLPRWSGKRPHAFQQPAIPRILFLPISFIGFHLNKNKQFRYIWMTVMRLCVLLFLGLQFPSLMVFSTLVSYLAGLRIPALGPIRGAASSAWSFRSRSICSLLGFFKYANFVLDTSRDVAPCARRRRARAAAWTSSCRSASRSTRSTRSRTSSTATAGRSADARTSSSSRPMCRCSRSSSPGRSSGSARSRTTWRSRRTPTARAGSRIGISLLRPSASSRRC